MKKRPGYAALELPDGIKLGKVRSLRFDETRNRIIVVTDDDCGVVRFNVVAREGDR